MMCQPRMVHHYVPLPEVLLFLPAQSQELDENPGDRQVGELNQIV